jgi:hypothetical protein
MCIHIFELEIEILIGCSTYHTNNKGQNSISSKLLKKNISYETKTKDIKEDDVCMSSKKTP